MSFEHQIVSQVEKARQDRMAAEALIAQYMAFIKSETYKFTGRIPAEGRDDELGIAMLAFYEAILAYERGRGAFLGFAAVNIKNRLIDHSRREKRHAAVISYDAQEDGVPLADSIADGRDEIETAIDRSAARSEIQHFSRQLADFGLSLSDVADNCPKQARTMDACQAVLSYARQNPTLLGELLRTKHLPMAALEASGVERKTMERHRKYLLATLLAYTNGYEIIRGHLSQMPAGREGRR